MMWVYIRPALCRVEIDKKYNQEDSPRYLLVPSSALVTTPNKNPFILKGYEPGALQQLIRKLEMTTTSNPILFNGDNYEQWAI